MHLAVGAQCVVERHAASATPAIDEGDDVGAQVALVVEHLAAQARIDGECGVERAAQRGSGRIDFRRVGEATQLRREDDPGHAT